MPRHLDEFSDEQLLALCEMADVTARALKRRHGASPVAWPAHGPEVRFLDVMAEKGLWEFPNATN